MPRTVKINASECYHVTIGPGLLADCGGLIAELVAGRRAAIISDDTIYPLYGETVRGSLAAAGFNAARYTFPAGEKAKNIATLNGILEFLAASRITRTDIVVALGGGVVGDIAGLAAGLYRRGVPLIQLPTTLLAAVDSSVGGKTAVNLSAGKNLAGLFKQPRAVLCDTDTLATLNDDMFACGIAEAVKCGVIADRRLFELIATAGSRAGLDGDAVGRVISNAVQIKGRIVEEDEFDTGLRQLLNFGHTLGHAMEKCSGYAVPHGHAVAAGMVMMARAAAKLGLADSDIANKIATVTGAYGLPAATDFAPEELLAAALLDKKLAGDTITLVLPRKIGECFLYPVPAQRLGEIIRLATED